MFLMSDDFVQSDFVLHQKSNFDVKLIDILLRLFILANSVDDGLSQSFKFHLFLKIKIAVIEEMDKVLNRLNWLIFATRYHFIRFTLLASTHKGLDLDNLFHVFFVMSHFFLKSCSNHLASSPCWEFDYIWFPRLKLHQLITNKISAEHAAYL